MTRQSCGADREIARQGYVDACVRLHGDEVYRIGGCAPLELILMSFHFLYVGIPKNARIYLEIASPL